jgi:hypothetical protein
MVQLNLSVGYLPSLIVLTRRISRVLHLKFIKKDCHINERHKIPEIVELCIENVGFTDQNN